VDFLVPEETVGYGACLDVDSASARHLNLVPLMHQILKVHPGDVPGELMPRAASNIFSVTISIFPLHISHRSLRPAAADRPTACR
jgi:hypothetical protein